MYTIRKHLETFLTFIHYWKDLWTEWTLLSFLQWKHAYIGLRWLLQSSTTYMYNSTSVVFYLVYCCQDNTLNCPQVNTCGFVFLHTALFTYCASIYCGSVPLCIQKVLLITHLHSIFAWLMWQKKYRYRHIFLLLKEQCSFFQLCSRFQIVKRQLTAVFPDLLVSFHSRLKTEMWCKCTEK